MNEKVLDEKLDIVLNMYKIQSKHLLDEISKKLKSMGKNVLYMSDPVVLLNGTCYTAQKQQIDHVDDLEKISKFLLYKNIILYMAISTPYYKVLRYAAF
jgi:pyridoxal/pyridoxine/pyridoxamine kinase